MTLTFSVFRHSKVTKTFSRRCAQIRLGILVAMSAASTDGDCTQPAHERREATRQSEECARCKQRSSATRQRMQAPRARRVARSARWAGRISASMQHAVRTCLVDT